MAMSMLKKSPGGAALRNVGIMTPSLYKVCVERGWAPRRLPRDFGGRPTTVTSKSDVMHGKCLPEQQKSHAICDGSLGGILDIPADQTDAFLRCLAADIEMGVPHFINDFIPPVFRMYFDLDMRVGPGSAEALASISNSSLRLYVAAMVAAVRCFYPPDPYEHAIARIEALKHNDEWCTTPCNCRLCQESEAFIGAIREGEALPDPDETGIPKIGTPLPLEAMSEAEIARANEADAMARRTRMVVRSSREKRDSQRYRGARESDPVDNDEDQSQSSNGSASKKSHNNVNSSSSTADADIPMRLKAIFRSETEPCIRRRERFRCTMLGTARATIEKPSVLGGSTSSLLSSSSSSSLSSSCSSSSAPIKSGAHVVFEFVWVDKPQARAIREAVVQMMDVHFHKERQAMAGIVPSLNKNLSEALSEALNSRQSPLDNESNHENGRNTGSKEKRNQRSQRDREANADNDGDNENVAIPPNDEALSSILASRDGAAYSWASVFDYGVYDNGLRLPLVGKVEPCKACGGSRVADMADPVKSGISCPDLSSSLLPSSSSSSSSSSLPPSRFQKAHETSCGPIDDDDDNHGNHAVASNKVKPEPQRETGRVRRFVSNSDVTMDAFDDNDDYRGDAQVVVCHDGNDATSDIDVPRLGLGLRSSSSLSSSSSSFTSFVTAFGDEGSLDSVSSASASSSSFAFANSSLFSMDSTDGYASSSNSCVNGSAIKRDSACGVQKPGCGLSIAADTPTSYTRESAANARGNSESMPASSRASLKMHQYPSSSSSRKSAKTQNGLPACAKCAGGGSNYVARCYAPVGVIDGNGAVHSAASKQLLEPGSVYRILSRTTIRPSSSSRIKSPGFAVPTNAREPDLSEKASRKGAWKRVVAGNPMMDRQIPMRSIPSDATAVPPGCARIREVQRFLRECFARSYPAYKNVMVDMLYYRKGLSGYVAHVVGTGSRYCYNIGNSHSTRDVRFEITLKYGVRQRCSCGCIGKERKFGVDCKHFSSPEVPLPPSIAVLLFGYPGYAEPATLDLVVQRSSDAISARASDGRLPRTASTALLASIAVLRAMVDWRKDHGSPELVSLPWTAFAPLVIGESKSLYLMAGIDPKSIRCDRSSVNGGMDACDVLGNAIREAARRADLPDPASVPQNQIIGDERGPELIPRESRERLARNDNDAFRAVHASRMAGGMAGADHALAVASLIHYEPWLVADDFPGLLEASIQGERCRVADTANGALGVNNDHCSNDDDDDDDDLVNSDARDNRRARSSSRTIAQANSRSRRNPSSGASRNPAKRAIAGAGTPSIPPPSPLPHQVPLFVPSPMNNNAGASSLSSSSSKRKLSNVGSNSGRRPSSSSSSSSPSAFSSSRYKNYRKRREHHYSDSNSESESDRNDGEGDDDNEKGTNYNDDGDDDENNTSNDDFGSKVDRRINSAVMRREAFPKRRRSKTERYGFSNPTAETALTSHHTDEYDDSFDSATDSDYDGTNRNSAKRQRRNSSNGFGKAASTGTSHSKTKSVSDGARAVDEEDNNNGDNDTDRDAGPVRDDDINNGGSGGSNDNNNTENTNNDANNHQRDNLRGNKPNPRAPVSTPIDSDFSAAVARASMAWTVPSPSLTEFRRPTNPPSKTLARNGKVSASRATSFPSSSSSSSQLRLEKDAQLSDYARAPHPLTRPTSAHVVLLEKLNAARRQQILASERSKSSSLSASTSPTYKPAVNPIVIDDTPKTRSAQR